MLAHRVLPAISGRPGQRLFDLGVALTGLVLTAPLFAVAALASALGAGPYLESRRFRGGSGHPVSIAHFGLQQGLVSRFLDAFGLRGVPALIAVSRGDVSLVGPRPRPLDGPIDPGLETDAAAVGVRPGLVSLYDVRCRANTAFDSEEAVDAEYALTASARCDAGILLRRILLGPASAKPEDASATPDRLELFDLPVDNLTIRESLEWILHALETRRGARVYFLNAHCANVAERDGEYRRCLRSSSLTLPDGIGVRIAARLAGRTIRENTNGTDLFPRLCATLRDTDHGVYLLGGRPGVADQVREWIDRNHPGVPIVGARHGHFASHEADDVAAEIRESGARLLLVAMGVPGQERWIDRHIDATGVSVAIGVGGLFDFYSGRIPRAPKWMRELGLEWVYRLAQEPGRMWRRYLVGNVAFLMRALRRNGSKEVSR